VKKAYTEMKSTGVFRGGEEKKRQAAATAFQIWCRLYGITRKAMTGSDVDSGRRWWIWKPWKTDRMQTQRPDTVYD
jgi:hypothetical protein